MDFQTALENKGIILSEKQLNQFERYYQLLVEWNEKMNLTAITDHDDVYLKHFLDSLTISFDYDFNNQSIVDVGAGAGFPSIPLKIVYPDLHVTIVDSLGKRITFLNHLIQELGLDNVEAVHARAEEFALKHRESFDIATARAVARLNILDELCMPEASKGIEKLGGKIVKDVAFTLTDENDHRHNLIIHKVKNTPAKYPRAFGQIKKKPL